MMQKDIKCPNCGTLFGKESANPDGTILAIKNRDLYRLFTGGKVWGPCRGCGNIITWPPESR